MAKDVDGVTLHNSVYQSTTTVVHRVNRAALTMTNAGKLRLHTVRPVPINYVVYIKTVMTVYLMVFFL